MAEENGQSTYVVQTRQQDGEWTDSATVSVPPRTKRKTILEKALAGFAPKLGEKWECRVLDEESARITPVESEEQPPRLKIG
jgi:hypothetical protein